METNHDTQQSERQETPSEKKSRAARRAHELGVAHKWTLEEAREAGRKGGLQSGKNKRARKGGQ